jgi:hypothetical protein
MALRDTHERFEFMVGIGCIADMNGEVASASSVEFGTTRRFIAKHRFGLWEA